MIWVDSIVPMFCGQALVTESGSVFAPPGGGGEGAQPASPPRGAPMDTGLPHGQDGGDRREGEARTSAGASPRRGRSPPVAP